MEIEIGNDEHYGYCVLITYLKSREESFEKKKELEQALKLMKLVEENIREGRNLFFLTSLLEEAKK